MNCQLSNRINASILLFAASGALPATADPNRSNPTRPANADSVRIQVTRLIKEGRIDDAVRTVQTALKNAPDDAAIRNEFIDLHLSLARGWLREERFDDVAKALTAILSVAPGQPDALRLQRAIDDARRSIPKRIDGAKRWIDIEWFEPAFNTFRQAIALSPENRDRWLDDYRAAAVGAGDDHYLTKNFHQAFYYYDAATQLDAERNRSSDATLAARWIQSAIHALSHDADLVGYPQDHWKMIYQRAEKLRFAEDEPFRLIIAGLAYESAGQADRAAESYINAIGDKNSRHRRDSVAALRSAALNSVRQYYDVGLTRRRIGLWQRHESGDWQTLDVGRFRVHHRNPAVAQRVEDALNFHFSRIAHRWAHDEAEIPWSQPADIYIHADADAFAVATEQPGNVTAVSHVQLQGDRVISKRIDAHQRDPLLLSSSLAHELAHLMAAELRRDRPLPPVIAEGIALDVEPACRHRQFARIFADLKHPASLTKLLAAADAHPPETNFYAEAHRLTTVLLSRVDVASLMSMTLDGHDAARIASRCGFTNKRQLQTTYRNLHAASTPESGRLHE